MPTTSNFGWTTPADTDLVKDGAAAIRTLGNGIDTSLIDLKGGTTGQVLSKASNTDLDYSWVTPNVGDITEVQAGTGISIASGTGPIPIVTNTVATTFDAAGDLIYGTGADTFTKLTLGTAGQVLKVNSGATAPEWGAASGGTNPNLIINGSFLVNQRAYTSGTNLASGSYGFDRWKSGYTNTALTFTSAPNGQEVTISTSGVITQIVERANIPAGSYILSWSGTATGRIYNVGATAPSYAASPVTFTADGLANVTVEFTASGSSKTLSNVKLETGSTATTFTLAGNTIAGETQMCQRYYYRYTADNLYSNMGLGFASNTTDVIANIYPPTNMRAIPTSVEYSNLRLTEYNNGYALSSLTIQSNSNAKNVNVVTAVTTGLTQFRPYTLGADNSTAAYIGFSAEL